jgi:Cys-rich peptide (TIGR04165 family)
MKSEELSVKCPECGSTNKSIARKRNKDEGASHESDYVRHVPSGSCSVIVCTECGHTFEVCQERDMPVKIRKITLSDDE